MGKRRSLSLKLTYFFMILVVSVLITTGFSTFVNQTRIYMSQNEQRLMNIVDYLSGLISMEGEEFVAYQNIILEYGDDILIPHDYDGNYHPAKINFYKEFNEEYPRKAPGVDVKYEDMSDELKILYGTYKHEYYLHIFETAVKSFGIDYAYYVVPTGEPYHMYYVIDAIREEKTVDGEKYIKLNFDADQPIDIHQHMWDAWNSGEYVPGFDITNNEFGINCVYCYPLIIKEQKLGVICADISYEKINKDIVKYAFRHVISIGVIVLIICIALSCLIGAKYVKRLIKLKDEINEFSNTKNPDISIQIIQDIKGNDEIYDLAKQTSIMISEIGTYMNALIEKNKELTEAHEKIRIASEMANKDALTGIRNKNAYDSEVKMIEEAMAKDGFTRFGIAMIDVNYLKIINDSFGHDKGNVTIRKVCMLVCQTFTHSPVFRVGGDEFVVILKNSDYENAELLVAKLKGLIEAARVNDNLDSWERISAAVGWTLFDPQKDSSVRDVFERADELMYENKKAMKAERK